MSSINPTNYLPLNEAARLAGVSPRTIRRWAAEGILHVVYEPIICGRRSMYSVSEIIEVRAARARLAGQPRIAAQREKEIH